MKRVLILLSYVLFISYFAVADNDVVTVAVSDTCQANQIADGDEGDKGDGEKSKFNLFSGTWTTSSTPAIKLDENYYTNWAATGISQISFVGTFNGNYKYSHSKFIWDNVVDLALGVYWQDLIESDSLPYFETRRKNDDKIDLTSTFSMKMKKAWNVNASANFKTQFMEGFQYVDPTDPGTLVSSFMAPGYLTTALGFECKKDFWNVAFSFLTGKTTFLLDENVIAAGQLYGVDTTGGKRVYAGLGSYLKFYLKKDIAPNLNFYTRLELFYDYRKPNYHDGIDQGAFGSWEDNSWLKENGRSSFARMAHCMRYDTDVDFEFKLEYRFSSFLAAYFSSRFKYDSDFSGVAPLFGNDESHWQFYQSAGVQIYFNWKTPKAK